MHALRRSNLRKKILPVPRLAIINGERSHYVFKVEGKTVRRVAVKVDDEDELPTILKGLQEGDVIVVKSGQELKDGMAIHVETIQTEL